MTCFAVIDVGSYELSMKIYEQEPGRIREIDHLRYRLDLGTQTYATGKLSTERVDELCRVLRDFSRVMAEYKVRDYRAYGTSAIREMDSREVVLDQIEMRTGIRIEVISNSEQRFLDYKSVASKGETFDALLEHGTVILDIGGGSIQLSLFDDQALTTTQNLKIGVLRLREELDTIGAAPSKTQSLVTQIVDTELDAVKRFYMDRREIQSIILVDDYLSAWLTAHEPGGSATLDQFNDLMAFLCSHSTGEIAAKTDTSQEHAQLLYISALLTERVFAATGALTVWAPGVTLCDGMAYEYAEAHGLVTAHNHDFERDILECARNINRRYLGSVESVESLGQLSCQIYDCLGSRHGLGPRERLFLQLAAILHDCGRYISMMSLGECSYQIIMATEIIGISHREREILANIVRFVHDDFIYYDEMEYRSSLDLQGYLTVAKLTAILRIADGLDYTDTDRVHSLSCELMGNELRLIVESGSDLMLERGLFEDRAKFFKEVYNVTPIIIKKS